LLIQVNSSNLQQLKKLINEHDDKAFVIVNETKYIENGFIKK